MKWIQLKTTHRRHKLSQENVNCITMKYLSYRLKESDKRAVLTCGNFIFAKPRPNLSPFFPTRFLSSLWIYLLIRFSFFLQDLFQSLFKIWINLFNVSCKFFLGFSKFYPRVEVQNIPNFPFSQNSFWNQKSSWFLKSKSESGVEVRNWESISKNLESKSGVGSRFLKI